MSLILNVQSARHRDANNYHGSVNMVVPLSAFDDGQVWRENRNGSYPFDGVQGDLIRVEPSFVKFNPKALHCAMLPTGTRFLLIAFHIRSLNLLRTEDRVLWSQWASRIFDWTARGYSLRKGVVLEESCFVVMVTVQAPLIRYLNLSFASLALYIAWLTAMALLG